MESFKGKNVVITGGTRGIGKAISLVMAEAGAHVVALYARDRKSAEALAELATQREMKISTLRGDLTDPESFEKVVSEIKQACPQIDFLIHCAASGVHKAATALTDKHMRWTFDINFFVAHKLVAALVERIPAGGRIVGLTSPGGTRTIPHYAAIGASKGALESLFRHYAQELAPKGISVNMVCPGMVMTDAAQAFPELEQRLSATLKATPTGQLTTVEQVAHMVHFLCQKPAAQIVGQTIVMDGGKGLMS